MIILLWLIYAKYS